MMTVYRSRVDAWLFAILGVGMGVALTASVGAAIASWPVVAWPAIPGLLIGVGLPLWILSSTRYIFDEGELRVRSGPFTWRIPVAEITRVTRTSNPLSSPALSLRRLRIEYGDHRSLMVSPRDEEAFLAELERRRSTAT
jgi:hypothetical protein